jgi:hypothetical protein
MNHIQNNPNPEENPYKPMDFRFNILYLKKKNRKPKVSRLLPKVCDLQKENHTLGYGFKIYRKSSLA